MNGNELYRMKGFYENELKNRILPFWLLRCEDREHGGYFNCFDNRGKKLLSHDKYTWSQGRFVWMFSRLAATGAPVFTKAERAEFLRLAKSGCDFLMKYCLMGENDWRCVYLMSKEGVPKQVEEGSPLDMSIYADCFVVLAMAAFSLATGDDAAYAFGKRLYESILARVSSGNFHTLPYPLSKEYKAHGIPMILSNVTKELHDAAAVFEPLYCAQLKNNLRGFMDDILNHFTDEEYMIHEVISKDNRTVPGLLGGHANPGHTLEDMWFMLDGAELLESPALTEKIAAIALRTLERGWDELYGGLLHFCDIKGGHPRAALSQEMMEPTVPLVKNGWGDKLWWVHSEALYTTLRLYRKTGQEQFAVWYEKIFSYVFEKFPNPDREIGEWIQILRRDGSPQDKVVALPVKDPYHITRNLLLILEELYGE